ncbi:hypothetical protein PENFLA_c005G10105 [Penicillium flavigenum]|uniref:Major facilitator superfamily (MFS) profile domain-containing protein n=1 Tax=Penicillium flavigenum TaxID=254877 RepID=A0A1V6TP92_9EURO|nr:hypothetical protein PENFLA_c005G10105 [Penicillium flavigenum]
MSNTLFKSMDSEKKYELANTPSCLEIEICDHTPANSPGSNEALIQDAIEAIGMGRYQWKLMASCGFGFIADQMLLASISLVMPQASKEFSPQYATLLSAAQYAGLAVGAVFFGFVSNLIGRRLTWQVSIFGVSIFTAAGAGSSTWATLNVFIAFEQLADENPVAIDLTVFAECLPRRWGFLLTGLVCLWGLGSAITGLIAWPLVVNFCCPQHATSAICSKADNMGWRYLYIILGVFCLLMSILRTFVLGMSESPKWLASQGNREDAVVSINTISRVNKSTYTMSIDQLHQHPTESNNIKNGSNMVINLFRGNQQVRSMICLIFIWLLVGIAYPVYQVFLTYYLEANGIKLGDGRVYKTYRDFCISAVVSIFGPILSSYLVEIHFLGRRRSITLMAWGCSICAGSFTAVETEAQSLALSCMINFFLNAMYAVIYG